MKIKISKKFSFNICGYTLRFFQAVKALPIIYPQLGLKIISKSQNSKFTVFNPFLVNLNKRVKLPEINNDKDKLKPNLHLFQHYFKLTSWQSFARKQAAKTL